MTRLIVLFIVLFNVVLFSQAFETKWGVGVGGIYPRFFSVSGTGYSGNVNFGAYFSAEKYFNEQVSLRGLFNFVHMTSYYLVEGSPAQSHTVNHFALNLDAIYKFLPCRLVSPYGLIGLGVTNFTNKHSFNPDVDDTFFGYQLNLGVGIEWGFNEDISLKTEAVYRTTSNNKIDGNERLNENSKGLFGGNGDTYATLDVGVIWYFNKGAVSDICDKCPEGYREVLIRDTVVVEKVIEKNIVDTVFIKSREPYLFGVNFAFDKYELNPESYAVLERVIEILKENPELDIIISGYTDNKGSDGYNEKLSENRARTVFNYLVANGIKKERISENWFGEEQPLKDNNSEFNRAFNRRVEIKIQN